MSSEKDLIAHCPTCRRFIGTVDTCPYCDSPAERRISLRSLRIAAIVLAVIGISLMIAAGRCKETPIVQVDSITPSMNFGYVRIQGAAVRNATVRKTDNEVTYFSCIVNDGTGKIRITAYDDRAAAICNNIVAPKKGDVVDAAGSLSIDATGRKTLYVEISDHFQTKPSDDGGQ